MNTPSRSVVIQRILVLALLAGTIFFFVHDLLVDALFEGEFLSLHFILEFIVFLGVSVVLAVNARDLPRLRRRLRREERRNLLFSTALADSINDQMDEWRLTRSEKSVAWYIIKGYRFSEIAYMRGVKESTTRLQATSVYAKAGVSGRAEFVAEILQPLLLTIPSTGVSADVAPSDQARRADADHPT